MAHPCWQQACPVARQGIAHGHASEVKQDTGERDLEGGRERTTASRCSSQPTKLMHHSPGQIHYAYGSNQSSFDDKGRPIHPHRTAASRRTYFGLPLAIASVIHACTPASRAFSPAFSKGGGSIGVASGATQRRSSASATPAPARRIMARRPPHIAVMRYLDMRLVPTCMRARRCCGGMARHEQQVPICTLCLCCVR